MSIHLRIVLFVICLVVPVGLFAQTDVCSTLPSVGGGPSEVVVEQLRERADIQARQEKDRALWIVQMFPVKYLESAEALKALCIFSAEVIPQPALHMISVRAAQNNLAAIGEAIKRLDTPQIGPLSVEMTVHVLMASDAAETMKPVPSELKAVVDQLKGVIAYKEFYLVDTLLGSVADTKQINLSGSVRGLRTNANGSPIDSNTSFTSIFRIDNRDQANSDGTLRSFRNSIVRLQGLSFSLDDHGGVRMFTDIDVPVGKQVVVGKATAGDRAFILVVSVKILN